MSGNVVLKKHFDAATAILERKAEVAADLAEWRAGVRNDGLVPTVIYKIARDQLRNAEQQRKAADVAEAERLYRAGLDLPLFNYYAGEEAE